MDTEKTLQALIEIAGKYAPFDEAHYPELVGSTPEVRFTFALRHSALHFAKTSGKIAGVIEDADHGNPLDMETLHTNIWKSLVNTLWLAKYAEMPASEIVKAMETKYGEKLDRSS